jgi:hypothetical protein
VNLRFALAAVFDEPVSIGVEIAWRWIFGVSALSISAFALIPLKQALDVTPEEQELLASRSPVQIAQAVLQISHGAVPVALRLAAIVIPAILLLWIAAATIGRGFVMTRLSPPTSVRPRWSALASLHVLRVLSVLLLIAAYLGCSAATSLVISPSSSNYALAIVIFLVLFSTSLVLCSFLHWILSLACIYSARQGFSVAKAVRASLHLLRARAGQLMSIAAQNSSIRTLTAIVFTLVAALPLVVYPVPALFWTLEIGIFLLYCVISDVLLLARLAAYIEVTERAREPVEMIEN